MDVRIKFLGGAQSVTGSKFLLEIDEYKILIDCGLFQGVKELRMRNWDKIPIEIGSIDAVALTHAHIDHSGYLPRLCREGFKGPVFCTNATADLLEIMLLDAAKLQEEEARYARKKGYSVHKYPQPLYTTKDAEQVFLQLQPYSFDHRLQITDDIIIIFRNAGHILGAAIIEIFLQGKLLKKKIVFSGDIGRYDQPIMRDPASIEEADILLVESTYGNRVSPAHRVKELFAQYINEALDNQGCILIPAFSVGRTQMLIYYLRELFEEGSIPDIPVYLDSPMAIEVTGLYRKYYVDHKLGTSELHNHQSVFAYKNLNYYQSQKASVSLNDLKRNAIIISASGMCSGGRILHHLYHRLPRPNDMILFVGFQAEGTRGRAILEGENAVSIFGEEVKINCQIRKINGLSAHADKLELERWLKNFQDAPKKTFIVHGEADNAHALAHTIKDKLNWKNVWVPEYLESFELFQSI